MGLVRNGSDGDIRSTAAAIRKENQKLNSDYHHILSMRVTILLYAAILNQPRSRQVKFLSSAAYCTDRDLTGSLLIQSITT
jgi:hypothetical protein